MNYILTQEEMDNLTNKKTSEEEIKDLNEALEWCRLQLMQKGCCNGAYCDTCPISELGFYMVGDDCVDKVEGEGATPTEKISDLICNRYRDYSK